MGAAVGPYVRLRGSAADTDRQSSRLVAAVPYVRLRGREHRAPTRTTPPPLIDRSGAFPCPHIIGKERRPQGGNPHMNDTENTIDQESPEQTTIAPADSPSDAPIAADGTPDPEADRRALEEAHGRLDAAQKRIDVMLGREVERLVESRLVCPSDLFDLGKIQLSNLLDEAGAIDSEKVTSAVDELLRVRPYLAGGPVTVWGHVGGGHGLDSYGDDDTPDWKSALRGRLRD